MPDTATAAGAIDDALYRAWLTAKSSADHWTGQLKQVEATIRDQTAGATVVTVDGQPVARRIIREARNVTWVSDFYRRIGEPG